MLFSIRASFRWQHWVTDWKRKTPLVSVMFVYVANCLFFYYLWIVAARYIFESQIKNMSVHYGCCNSSSNNRLIIWQTPAGCWLAILKLSLLKWGYFDIIPPEMWWKYPSSLLKPQFSEGSLLKPHFLYSLKSMATLLTALASSNPTSKIALINNIHV